MSRGDELTIRTWRDAGTTLIALYGELDLMSAPALEKRLACVQRPSLRRLVVDLTGLQFIDCGGLRVLLVAAQRAQTMSQQFQLLPGPPQVQRVLELTGWDRLFSG